MVLAVLFGVDVVESKKERKKERENVGEDMSLFYTWANLSEC